MKRLSLIVFVFLITSCVSVKYSFTGASISADVKTINIQYFTNNASLIEPSLSPSLTQALKDKFTSETNLNLSNNEADLYLRGEITDYRTSPIAIQNNDQGAMSRLTVKVHVEYTNTKDEKKNFDTRFERYADYPSDVDFESKKEELLAEIIDYLVQDIFNKAVINW